jgi:hypothetical protein
MPKTNMAKIQEQLERASGKSAKAATVEAPAKAKANVPPSRLGKTHIGAYLNAENKTSLRLVQAKSGKDLQSILQEALNEAYRRYGVPVVGS